MKKQEYWDLFANLKKHVNDNDVILKAKFVGTTTEKVELKAEDEVNKVIEAIKDGSYSVENINKKVRARPSKPPFITSTLQQDAGVKYNYNAKRVMSIAQKLYEGVELGKERVGLITYMRTDSIRLSDEFIDSSKSYITEKYGEKYYKGMKKSGQKGKNIQDAHEAIRRSEEHTSELQSQR